MKKPTQHTLDALAREVEQLRAALSARETQIEALAKEALSKQKEIERLTEQLEKLHRRLFGRSSEKFHPGQQALFDLDGDAPREEPAPADLAPDDEEALEPKASKRKTRRPRKMKTRDLPRERIVHDVPKSERICDHCGESKQQIGEAITEELDYVPASFLVREHVRPKYACKGCGDGVVIADLPPRLIEGGQPGPGLLAQIVTAKYCDHLPLYRQEAIYRRSGVELSRQTMCDWIRVAAEHLLAIVLAMRRDLLTRAVLLSDDTHVLVQTNAESKGCHRAYLWVWLSAEDDLVLYDFELTRGQSVVDAFLEEFQGDVIVVDGYPGYNPCASHGVKRAGCMAHARRYVHEGMKSYPKEASELLVWIQMLYLVEKRAKDFDPAQRLALRQEESKPVLEKLRAAVERMKPTVLPTSSLGEALTYLENQWANLIVFADDGRVPIDNNASERAMRPVALGRKNWLFAGSTEGGKRAATLYSLVETCKRLDIPPFEYLRDVLGRISTHPHRLIHELTPAGWKAAREKARAETAPATN
ncbi:MAG: IS66 family transposase [Dehalococcoidia bacterium]|nr:IS66 family transposase [Dehalococcoidia bacterium]